MTQSDTDEYMEKYMKVHARMKYLLDNNLSQADDGVSHYFDCALMTPLLTILELRRDISIFVCFP